MPADLIPAPGYGAMNSDRLGIAAQKAERASWRATRAYRSPDEIPPQPVGVRPDDVELHALRQTRQFADPIGWAWCFGIDRRKHREYLQAIEGNH